MRPHIYPGHALNTESGCERIPYNYTFHGWSSSRLHTYQPVHPITDTRQVPSSKRCPSDLKSSIERHPTSGRLEDQRVDLRAYTRTTKSSARSPSSMSHRPSPWPQPSSLDTSELPIAAWLRRHLHQNTNFQPRVSVEKGAANWMRRLHAGPSIELRQPVRTDLDATSRGQIKADRSCQSKPSKLESRESVD